MLLQIDWAYYSKKKRHVTEKIFQKYSVNIIVSHISSTQLPFLHIKRSERHYTINRVNILL